MQAWHGAGVSSSDVGLVIFMVALLLIVVLSIAVAVWIRRRVGARYRAEGRIECGLRVVTGEVPGLSKRWRHGLARLDDNALIFGQGRLGGYVRGRAPHATDVRVSGPLQWDRKPKPREWIAIAPWGHVFRAPQPGGAVVEVLTVPPYLFRLEGMSD